MVFIVAMILSLLGADKLQGLRHTHVSKSTVHCKNSIMIVKIMQCFLFSPKKFFTIYRQTTEGSFDIKELLLLDFLQTLSREDKSVYLVLLLKRA